MFCALIMAGGKGTRFWPLSTEEKPKQFLKLLGDKTMIQMTVDRLKKVIDIDKIFIVTNEKYVSLVKEQIRDIKARNIIIEPEGRNTAPCIALSTFVIKAQHKEATIAVLPSDHIIREEDKFLETLKTGYQYIEKNKKSLVTIGMRVTRPETGYGYIKYSDEKININNHEILKVEKFVEKPNAYKALRYMSDGNYLWNGGMFIWDADNILSLCKKYISNTYEVLHEIFTAEDIKTRENLLKERYKNLEAISIDYAVMEKSSDIYVIPSEFGWDDIGTWSALERYKEKDENNNIISGKTKTINAQGNMIISSGKPIVISDVNDIFCVETEDMIFIGKKDNINDIKAIREICMDEIYDN